MPELNSLTALLLSTRAPKQPGMPGQVFKILRDLDGFIRPQVWRLRPGPVEYVGDLTLES